MNPVEMYIFEKALAQVRADHEIKLLTRGVGNKITCDKCGRRCYGGTYEVTARDADKRK